MNTLYLGTNTKMYKTTAQTVAYLQALDAYTSDISRHGVELFVIPSYTSLHAARMCVPSDRISLGAQNMGWEAQGQYTGEISPLMLREAGVQIVEIGHSERRHVLHETDEEENRKVLCALAHGFRPLLCIGETQDQKLFGIGEEVLRIQLKIGLYGMPSEQAERLMVAYEPVWAIGEKGVPATPEYAEKMHRVIRETLQTRFGACATHIPILYGGSVNEENCEALCALSNVDGLFVGRAAWEADRFDRIIRKTIARWREEGRL